MSCHVDWREVISKIQIFANDATITALLASLAFPYHDAGRYLWLGPRRSMS